MNERAGPSPRLVLASASPARARVLRGAGFEPTVVVSGVDEDIEAPSTRALVLELAVRKARAVAPQFPDALVLGCDSILEVSGRNSGKPRTPDEARAAWTARAGTSGVLMTGHALIDTAADRMVSDVVETVVHFGRPDPRELDAYIGTGEPLRVAGGFTIDGLGAAFVDGVDGDPNNVLGISVVMLRTLLHELGLSIIDLWS